MNHPEDEGSEFLWNTATKIPD